MDPTPENLESARKEAKWLKTFAPIRARTAEEDKKVDWKEKMKASCALREKNAKFWKDWRPEQEGKKTERTDGERET